MRVLLVEEGFSRGNLAAARALGRAGWTVGVGSPRRGPLAGASRWTSAWHRVPGPEQGLEAFLEAVAEAVDAEGYEVVFGAGDAEVLALAHGRDRLGSRVPYPEPDVVARVFDKYTVSSAAPTAGLSVPRSTAATESGFGQLGAPVVVKARLHWTASQQLGTARFDPIIATSVEQALVAAEQIRGHGAEPIFQEHIAGELTAHTTLIDRNGTVVACADQRSPMTWPPGAGVTARGETVLGSPELAARVASLLHGLGWFGLAQCQFLTGRDGEPKLIDVNGRFYGSLALAVAAGANFPCLWASLATGRAAPSGTAAEPGVHYQWLEADLQRAARERRGGLVRDVSTSLTYAPTAVHSIVDRHDIRPALTYGRFLAGLAVANARRRLGRGRGDSGSRPTDTAAALLRRSRRHAPTTGST